MARKNKAALYLMVASTIALGAVSFSVTAAPPTAASQAVLKAVTAEVKASAKDADSVKIRNLRMVKADGVVKFCGEVNAKNSYGGYTGFRPLAGFLMLNGNKPIHTSVSDIDNVDLSRAMCARDGF